MHCKASPIFLCTTTAITSILRDSMKTKCIFVCAFLCLVCLLGDELKRMEVELKTKDASFRLGRRTGGLKEVYDNSARITRVFDLSNTYLIQRKSGDITLDEKNDRVKRTDHLPGVFSYTCVNDAFPQFEITKRYWVVDGVLRRELTFKNNSSEKVYVLPFTESAFTPEFKKNGY